MDADERSKYYDIPNETEISIEELDRIWPHISNWWIQWNVYEPKDHKRKGDYVWSRTYKCRLNPNRKSSGPKSAEEGQVIKRRNRSQKKADFECQAQLKIIKNFKGDGTLEKVTIQTTKSHSHDMEVIDHQKITPAVREMIAHDIRKQYQNSHIALAMKNMDGTLSTGAIVNSKYVANVRKTVQGQKTNPNVALPEQDNVLRKELDLAIGFLQNNGGYVYGTTTKNGDINSLVFSKKELVGILHKYGALVQMDITHTINKYSWNLLTIYFRDQHGVWLPGGHALLADMDGPAIASALKLLRTFNPRWEPRYFIIDTSNAEHNAIDEAFTVGAQRVDVFYCKVHSNRTLTRKIPNEKIRHLLRQAMNARTALKCSIKIGEAIQLARSMAPANSLGKSYQNGILQYIERNWNMKNSKHWGTYARSHSCILLQTLSTNAIESFHQLLKNQTDIHPNASFGLRGSVAAVDAAIKRRITVMKQVESQFRTKNCSLCNTYSKLGVFPYPVQKMIVQEFHKAKSRFEEGSSYDPLNNARCECDFIRKYCLPCKHIFLCDLYDPGFITDEDWDYFTDGWEECGYEIYETKEIQYVAPPVYDPVRESVVANLFKEGIADFT